jgi:glycosyltransferase involved in cell wall biosynthesis
MRIAFFHNLPAGGAKRVAFEFIQRLVNTHEVDLYVYDNTSEKFNDVSTLVDNKILVNGGNESRIKLLGRLISMYRARRASKKMSILINSRGYDLALVMQCKVTNSPYLLRYLDIPSLYVCHEPSSKINEPHYNHDKLKGIFGFLKKIVISYTIKIDRINAKKATLISTSSLYSCEDLYRNYGVHPKLNYLGVDTEKFRPMDIPKESYILSVGALNAAKAQDFIIESVGTLRVKPPIKFIYNYSYGHKEYQQYLVDLANSLGVTISFNFMVSDAELVKAYNQAALTVFPSLLEPLGLVPLESMACGTPLIGVAEGGIRETIINNETGFLTERDPYAFGKAIDLLLNDTQLMSEMGRNGRRSVEEKWLWEHSFKTLEKNILKATA